MSSPPVPKVYPGEYVNVKEIGIEDAVTLIRIFSSSGADFVPGLYERIRLSHTSLYLGWSRLLNTLTTFNGTPETNTFLKLHFPGRCIQKDEVLLMLSYLDKPSPLPWNINDDTNFQYNLC